VHELIKELGCRIPARTLGQRGEQPAEGPMVLMLWLELVI
jgi:hypothetical protein